VIGNAAAPAMRAAPVLTNNVPRLGLSTPNPSAFVAGSSGVKAPYSVATVDAAREVAPMAGQLPKTNVALQQGAMANANAAKVRTASGASAAFGDAAYASGNPDATQIDALLAAQPTDPFAAPEGATSVNPFEKVFGNRGINFYSDQYKAPSAPAADPRDPQGMDPRPKTDQSVPTVQAEPASVTAATAEAAARNPDDYNFGGGIITKTPMPVSAQKIDMQPVENLNSSNDWQARNDLRSLAVSANSIVGTKSQKAAKLGAYQKALDTDFAKQQGNNPMALEAMRSNARAAETNATNDLTAQRSNVTADLEAQGLGIRGYQAGQEARLNTARIQDINAGIRGKNLVTQQAEQVAGLQKAYSEAKDDATREKLARQIQVMSGKYERADPKDSFIVVPGGKDEWGNALPGRVFDARNRQYVDSGAPAQPTNRPVGTTSTVNGKTAVWDGKKWIPQ